MQVDQLLGRPRRRRREVCLHLSLWLVGNAMDSLPCLQTSRTPLRTLLGLQPWVWDPLPLLSIPLATRSTEPQMNIVTHFLQPLGIGSLTAAGNGLQLLPDREAEVLA